jgi:beta-galactosidase GanA
MWDDIFTKAREEGLNLLQTYIFWNFHEREEGVYYFEERADIELFLQKAADHGLFVNCKSLRSPFINASFINIIY